MGTPSRSRQSRTQPRLSQEAMMVLAGLIASIMISPVWPRSDASSEPLCVAQILTSLSSEAVTIRRPVESNSAL